MTDDQAQKPDATPRTAFVYSNIFYKPEWQTLDEKGYPEFLEVIEKSAYDDMKWEYENVCKFATQYEEELVAARQEIEFLKAQRFEFIKNRQESINEQDEQLTQANQRIKELEAEREKRK